MSDIGDYEKMAVKIHRELRIRDAKELERMRLWREAFNVYSEKCGDPSLCCDVADSTLKRFDKTFAEQKLKEVER